MRSRAASKIPATFGLVVAVASFLCSPVAAGSDPSKSPVKANPPMRPSPCSFPSISQIWDFSGGPQGFYPVACGGGGLSVWEYGMSNIPGAPRAVWGTILSGNYPDNAGQGLASPSFTVTPLSYLVQIDHYFETEYVYDGLNVTLLPFQTVIQPIGGYTVSQISPSGSYYAYCVEGEPGWTGSGGGWRSDCFDLSGYMGSQVSLSFDFGSDASVTAAGWYISRIVLGGQSAPDAACCNPATGACVITNEQDCIYGGGIWHPEWTMCQPNPCPPPAGCAMPTVAYDWDFSYGSQGFTKRACDYGGVAVWEYGSTSYIPGAPPLVWGTILNGAYPNNSGEGLLSPSFTVDPSKGMVEVLHYFDTEMEYDGCNLSIYPYGTVVTPIGGYTVSQICPSGSYYAFCVDGEPGWTGQSGGWRVDCFDISGYGGLTIALEFDFGSDASATVAGWYLGRVRVGGDLPVPQTACCDPWTGTCAILNETDCAESGRIYHPEWTSCDPDPCPEPPPECLMPVVSEDWDFTEGGQGFEPRSCDAGGAQAWEYGSTALIPGAPIRVWGTVLNGPYPDNSGSGLGSPTFTVTETTRMAQVLHAFETEYGFDGGNVIVIPDGTVLPPISGYTVPALNTSPSYYAYCVDGEPGWTGSSGGWRIDCFDLSPYMGREISLELDFGSDASVTQAGWYVARVRIGGGADTGPPEPPSDLIAETLGADRVRISWVDNSDGEDAFVIDRREGLEGAWQQIQEVPQNTGSWEDWTVTGGVRYFYRIRARDGAEVSVYSNFAAALAGLIPAAPTEVVGTITSPVSIRLGWRDNATNEAGFHVQRRDSDFGSWFDLPANIPTDAHDFQNTGLTPSTRYAYRIRAYNQCGSSPWAYSNDCWTPVDPGNFGATVIVKKGTTLMGGVLVTVDHGQGFQFAGLTDSNGQCYIPGLRLSDRIRATYDAQVWYTCRDYRLAEPGQDMGMRLTIDSDTRDANANLTPYLVSNSATVINLELGHPLFRFDLGFSTEWDMIAADPYWNQLQQGLQAASDYLYDVSDGQMALGQVAIWDNKGQWDEADVQILNDVWPNANLDNFLDCDNYSSEEHIFMSRIWSNHLPHQPNWHRTLVHEMGHYVLDLMDEYENGSGDKAKMKQLKASNPAWYPKNYGFMDYQYGIDEMSSKNDYRPNYNYGCSSWACVTVQTEQLWSRGKSTWDQVEEKLEGWSPFADIIKPQAGWYVNGQSTSPDRQGPTSSIGTISTFMGNSGNLPAAQPPELKPQVEFVAYDGGPGSFETRVTVRDGESPVADARIYKRSENSTSYLGATNLHGELPTFGLHPGDEIHAYARIGRVVRHASWRIVAEDAGGRVNLSVAPGRAGPAREGESGPGAAVDVTAIGALSEPFLRLDLWSDETLLADPVVVGRYGSTVTEVPMHPAGPNHYYGELAIDPADPEFDGRGLFEISIWGQYAQSEFVASFLVQRAEVESNLQVYTGTADLNIQPDDVTVYQLASGTNSNASPYRPSGFSLPIVGDLFSLHLSEDDTWPSSAGLNIAYPDSLLGSIDERSLRIYRWVPSGPAWQALEESHVSTEANVVSAMIGSGGVYCVFAEALTDDSAPPAPIEDFGAVGTDGLGAVQLLWTATGDDGGSGSAEQYLIAYSENEITGEDWGGLPQVTVAGGGHPAGEPMRALIHLPRQGQLYHLAMRAKDEASNLSSPSNPTYVVSGLADPNLVTAPPERMRAVDRPSDQGTAVNLRWDLSRDDGAGKNTVLGYRIYRTNPPNLFPDTLAYVPAGTTAATDSSAQNGLNYVYWVSAVDAASETMGEENRAFAARNLNVPVGDFSSDAITGVNDFGLLVNTFAIDSSDAEFDPLFDLDHDMDIADGDFEVFENAYPASGYPSTNPPGQNGEASVFRRTRSQGGAWRIDLTIRGTSNLAGYSFRVHYPHGSLAFNGAEPDSGAGVVNILRANGGVTPLFLVAISQADPSIINIANAIQRPSEAIAPDGEGYIGSLSFSGSGIDLVVISDFVAMDALGGLNFLGSPTGVEDGTTILRPYLFAGSPNPFLGQTMLRFQVPTQRKVKLAVYDAGGRLIRTLVHGVVAPGAHSVPWDGRDRMDRRVASGVYFYRFETEGYERARKIVRLR